MNEYIQTANCAVKKQQKDFLTRTNVYLELSDMTYTVIFQSLERTIFTQMINGNPSTNTFICSTELFDACFKKL